MYAKVIVDISHTNIDRVFEYTVPEEMELLVGMHVLVPFGQKKKVEGIVVGLLEQPEYDAEKLKPVIRPLEDFCAVTAEQLELAQYMKQRYNTTLAAALRFMVPAQLRGGRVSEKIQQFCFLTVQGEAFETAMKTLYKADGTPKYQKQIDVMLQLKEANKGVAASALPASPVKSLEKKGWIRIEESRIARRPFHAEIGLIEDYALTATQLEVLESILGTKQKRFLLHGVTGSGKTEVYIRVIKHCLEQGKTAILLVPEISLTPQTYLFLKQRFTEEIAVFHSGLSAGERYDEWRKVKRGEAKIVLGARSAVFAPLTNIGAIIIDEMHEGSYKADNYPKYSALEIARKRCELNDAILLLGSATPDIETYYEAEQGAYTILKMPQRLFGLSLPEVEIVDMREELRRGNKGVISGKLFALLSETLAKKKQAMLFLNRRGYSTFVMCRACGYTVKCDSCDVTMTYHKAQDSLKCHYCGREKPAQKICPECGKPYLKYFGTGTQQVEEQLKQLYPGVRLIRMDVDTMGAKDAHLKVFDDFAEGKADFLIGTQMITKGFDFGNVEVSAVLAADTMLNFPDYRSAERTFGQITQIAGRAGRKEQGRVVLQTYSPENYAVRFAQQHDYEGFYKQEIAIRKMAQLPPFSVFVQIQFSGKDEQQVIACVKDFLTQLKAVLLPYKNGIISVRASESMIKRIKDMHRYHILIQLKKSEQDAIDEMMQLFMKVNYNNVLTGIDTNPAGMV